jgi:hypothetical protein
VDAAQPGAALIAAAIRWAVIDTATVRASHTAFLDIKHSEIVESMRRQLQKY